MPSALAAIQQRKRAIRLMTDVAKAVPCMDCGGRFPACCMDYDHRPDTMKVRNVSKFARSGWRGAFTEIAKCDVVCANCHRIRTRDRASE